MAFELVTPAYAQPPLKKIDYASNVPEEETLRDFALIKQLLNNTTYEVPEHKRKKLIDSIFSVLDIPEVSIKNIIRVAQLILQMDNHNLAMVKLAIPRKVVSTSTRINARSLSDEALLDAVQEVVKKLPPTLPASPD